MSRDLKNKRFGKLVAKSRIRENNRTYWICWCDCGVEKKIEEESLIRNISKSCGCFRKEKMSLNLKGRKIGKLKVLELSTRRGKSRDNYWICLCDCGKVKEVTATYLSQGRIRSCGCSTKELSKQTCLEKYGVDNPSKNEKIMKKILKSQANKTILYHWKTGEEIVCVASYEPKVVSYWNENKINYVWHPQGFKMPNDHIYFPDAYLPDEDKYIEIKGYFRKDAKEKWDWFRAEHPNSELWNELVLKQMGIL
jgi:hypothetical protein